MKPKAETYLWVAGLGLLIIVKAWPYVEKRIHNDRTAAQVRAQKEPDRADGTARGRAAAQDAPLFEPYSAHFDEIFPARVLSMAARNSPPKYRTSEGLAPKYGINGSVGVTLRDVKKGQRYTVEISADRLIGPSSDSYVMTEDAAAVVLCPRLNYDFKELRRNTQTNFINVTFSVRQEGRSGGVSVTRRWQVHQVNDCPVQLESRTVAQDGTITSRPIRQVSVVAGFVNENHPWIDTLLLEAKNTGICDEFVGYQGGNRKIGPQISAIWRALQNRGLSYSSVTTTTSSPHHTLQYVRFLEQSVASTQANCLDGSVLLCSILRKIGFNVGVMLVPGHAYVCVFDQTNEHWLFGIETTLLGKGDLVQATRTATELGAYPLNKWGDDQQDNYQLVDISKLREAGFHPIPFDEAAAVPYLPTQSVTTERPSPTDVARQQRIALAGRLNQAVSELRAHRGAKNEESFRVSAFNLFSEIRQCQSAFNSMRKRPELESSGIPVADSRMASQYEAIVLLLRTKTIEVGTEVTASDLEAAKEITEALVDLANLPLNY